MVFDNSPAYNETIDTTVEEVEDSKVLPKRSLGGIGVHIAYPESKTMASTIASSDARYKHTRSDHQSYGFVKKSKHRDIESSHPFTHLLARETTRFRTLNVSETTHHDQSKRKALELKAFRVSAQTQNKEGSLDVEVIRRSADVEVIQRDEEKSPLFSSGQSARRLKAHYTQPNTSTLHKLRKIPVNKTYSRVSLLAQVNRTIASLNRSKLTSKWLQKFGCEFCGLSLSSRFRYCLHKHCMHVQRPKAELNSDDYDTCYSILTSEY